MMMMMIFLIHMQVRTCNWELEPFVFYALRKVGGFEGCTKWRGRARAAHSGGVCVAGGGGARVAYSVCEGGSLEDTVARPVARPA